MIGFLGVFLQAVSDPQRAKKVQEVIHHLDPIGVGMAVIGMGIVFLSLLLLYIVFFNVAKLINLKLKKNLQKEGKSADEIEKEIDISGDVNAAIGMALHLYLSEIHDFENTVLTIKKVSRTYSPWSSKIYGLRQIPR
ncbi:MAG TPA: OadG family protein [Ignavibacteriaceae bacterium]|jgi:Na+-transporting methylmalonyl-CoA/oxaloacetate decarboxylase gamma subunit|nr:OadG family protein [Ignavibacteriaceae bacterium]